jgi:hypothetical protein
MPSGIKNGLGLIDATSQASIEPSGSSRATMEATGLRRGITGEGQGSSPFEHGRNA